MEGAVFWTIVMLAGALLGVAGVINYIISMF